MAQSWPETAVTGRETFAHLHETLGSLATSTGFIFPSRGCDPEAQAEVKKRAGNQDKWAGRGWPWQEEVSQGCCWEEESGASVTAASGESHDCWVESGEHPSNAQAWGLPRGGGPQPQLAPLRKDVSFRAPQSRDWTPDLLLTVRVTLETSGTLCTVLGATTVWLQCAAWEP